MITPDETYTPDRDSLKDCGLPNLRVRAAYDAGLTAGAHRGVDEADAAAVANAVIEELQKGTYRPGVNLCPICYRLTKGASGAECPTHGSLHYVVLLTAFPPKLPE